jgi:hypothetical protein
VIDNEQVNLLAVSQSTSDIRIALISAGSALAGGVIGGGASLVVQARQWTHERRLRRSDVQREAYAGYVEEVLSLPRTLWRTTVGDKPAVEDEFHQRINHLQAGLLLDGSKRVRDFVANQLVPVLRRWQGTSDQLGAANVALPRDQRQSAFDIYIDTFRELVLPVLNDLADLMSADVHGR